MTPPFLAPFPRCGRDNERAFTGGGVVSPPALNLKAALNAALKNNGIATTVVVPFRCNKRCCLIIGTSYFFQNLKQIIIMPVMRICDIKNPETGITYREENKAKKHKYPIGALVEVPNEGNIRLYVIEHSRDCDESLLYVLGTKDLNPYSDETKRFYNLKAYHGYSESCLVLVS